MQRCKGYEQFSKQAIKLQAQVAATPRGLLFLIFNKPPFLFINTLLFTTVLYLQLFRNSYLSEGMKRTHSTRGLQESSSQLSWVPMLISWDCILWSSSTFLCLAKGPGRAVHGRQVLVPGRAAHGSQVQVVSLGSGSLLGRHGPDWCTLCSSHVQQWWQHHILPLWTREGNSFI